MCWAYSVHRRDENYMQNSNLKTRMGDLGIGQNIILK